MLIWQEIESKYIRPKQVAYIKIIFSCSVRSEMLFYCVNMLRCIYPNPSASSIFFQDCGLVLNCLETEESKYECLQWLKYQSNTPWIGMNFAQC